MDTIYSSIDIALELIISACFSSMLTVFGFFFSSLYQPVFFHPGEHYFWEMSVLIKTALALLIKTSSRRNIEII